MMATAEAERAVQVTIPADYLEDFRTALTAEIHGTSEWLTGMQKDLITASDEQGAERARTDRAGAARYLRAHMATLEQLPETAEKTVVENQAEYLDPVFEEVCRRSGSRVEELLGYSPLPFDRLPAAVEELRWATSITETFGF